MKNQPIIVGGEGESFFRRTWGSWKIAAIASFSALVFGTAILLMSIMAAANPPGVFPQEATESAQPVKIEYYLPYPGLLPDSPLYKLKMVRDWVKLRLARGDGEKGRLELLYADKRINAAVTLADGGKASLGVSTATKAEKYLEKAARRVLRRARAGEDVKSELRVLSGAAAKHEEMLENMAARTTGMEKEVIDATLATTRMIREEVDQVWREAS